MAAAAVGVALYLFILLSRGMPVPAPWRSGWLGAQPGCSASRGAWLALRIGRVPFNLAGSLPTI